ncbi:MAG TPA: protein-disulfide reductase DsbD family protein [Alphaproteobacteria bacterium]|nr:protein-disulfide reductase DsbD family protein [Alphaproteobacteria bacterium]
MSQKLKSKIVTFLLSFLIIGFSFSAASFAQMESEPDQYVQVRVIADKTQIKGGETVRLGVEKMIYPQWHTYWKNPGDSGTPAEIKWDLPEGFTVSEIEWPTASKIPFGPLTNYGYEGQVTLLQTLTIPQNIGAETFAINGKVNLLVCHDICIPETHDVFITFNGEQKPEPQNIQMAENKLPLNLDWKTEFYKDGDKFIIKGTSNDVSILNSAKDAYITPEDWGAIDNNANATIEFTKSGFTISQKAGERDLEEIKTLPFVLTYTDTANNKKSIRLTANPVEQTLALENNKSDITIISAILFALFGGIILNLMPCVFPVLSMKALSLINLGKKEENKARGYGISYTLGILVSFAFIGGILLILKSGGAQIGWGFQLQNPVVIIILAYLVFIIGLNLAGLFEFSGRLGKLGALTQKLSDKDGHKGAFFTGVLATLVATPCTAPFMGAALGFALTQPAYVSMIVFLALGFGLALPYLALCFIPALRSKLPKPGAWMQVFRQFLSFPMFLTAVWLIWVLSQQSGSMGVLMGLSGMVFITFATWLFKILPAKGWGRTFGIIAMILSGIFVATTIVTSKTMATLHTEEAQSEDQNWSAYSPQKLQDALKGDRPVFTNMTAAWCITCKVNEKVALKNETVTRLFANKNIEYFKGDWTNQDPEITQYLRSFERSGVPLYVYYGPRDTQTGQRPDPVVLPQILTAGTVEDVIQ